MRYVQTRGNVTRDEAQMIRALCVKGRELRSTTIANADLVDAMVALDVTFHTNYSAIVALRAFAFAVRHIEGAK